MPKNQNNSSPIMGMDKKLAQMLKSTTNMYVDYNKHKIVYESKTAFFEVSDELGVLEVWKNLNSQHVNVILYHDNGFCKMTIECTLVDISSGRIHGCLANKGVIIKEGYKDYLADYLILQVEYFNRNHLTKFSHYKLGWSRKDDLQGGYLWKQSIGAAYDSVIRDDYDNFLGCTGSEQKYQQMIDNEVIPNKSLHLPLVLGFTAPIVPLMYCKSNCPVLMTNLAGKSSHGKTTSLLLMASIWGKGIVSNNKYSIVKTFASTQKGLEATIRSNYGFPLIFDDYETSSGISFRTTNLSIHTR